MRQLLGLCYVLSSMQSPDPLSESWGVLDRNRRQGALTPSSRLRAPSAWKPQVPLIAPSHLYKAKEEEGLIRGTRELKLNSVSQDPEQLCTMPFAHTEMSHLILSPRAW